MPFVKLPGGLVTRGRLAVISRVAATIVLLALAIEDSATAAIAPPGNDHRPVVEVPGGDGSPVFQVPGSDSSLVVEAPASARVGDTFSLLGEVSNDGREPADQATVTITLPPELILHAVQPAEGCTTEDRLIVCRLGSLEPWATATVSLEVAPVAQGELRMTFTAGLGGLEIQTLGTTDVAGASCTITGTPGPDQLLGTAGADVICGLGGDDMIAGGEGNDVITAGSGDDRLDGGTGDDQLDGGEGVDTALFETSAAGVSLDLGAGSATGDGQDALQNVESAVGSRFGDTIRGSDGPNVLSGMQGTDLLHGQAGDDGLFGGDGEDYLEDGAGSDVLDGGEGSDTCPFREGVTLISCSGPSPDDLPDTAGPLDVTYVQVEGDTSPAWSIATAGPWSEYGVWDQGYVVVLLDVRGGDDWDHYALIRSTGSQMRSALFAMRRRGPDVRIRGLEAWRGDGLSVSARIALDLLPVDPGRSHMRWRVVTVYMGSNCVACMDGVPDGGGVVRPLP